MIPNLDVNLLSYNELEDMEAVFASTLRQLDVKIAQIDTHEYTLLSKHGLKLLSEMRQDTALRLGAVREEIARREEERYAKRQKRDTVTNNFKTTTGCTESAAVPADQPAIPSVDDQRARHQPHPSKR